jgi:hypothetical protein
VMSGKLDRLHRMTRLRLGYDRKMAAWQAFHEYADQLCARLPFAWRCVGMDNPTQNHTGTTNGANHVIVQEAVVIGRIRRAAGQPLCGRDSANLFVETASGPTCKRCLELAERILDRRIALSTTQA